MNGGGGYVVLIITFGWLLASAVLAWVVTILAFRRQQWRNNGLGTLCRILCVVDLILFLGGFSPIALILYLIARSPKVKPESKQAAQIV